MVWQSLGVLGVAALSIFSLQRPQLDRQAQPSQSSVTQAIATARVVANLGYSNLAASKLWLDFVQYFGHEDRDTTDYSLVQPYLEAIAALDPQFPQPYLYALPALAFRAGNPQAAAALLDAGTEAITPETNASAFRLPFQAAVVNFLFLGDLAAARDRYYLAADWLEAASGEGESLRDLGDRLLENPRSRLVRFDTWRQVYNSTNDPETRTIALQEMAQLGEVRQAADGSWELVPPPADE